MPKKLDAQRQALHGTWWRVPEEDTPGLAVYRREGAPLPPARGRHGFTLAAGGKATLHGPGPDDRRGDSGSAWQLDEQGLLHVDGAGIPAPIAQLDDDRLTLKR
ncbi:MAG: hypothetical protein HY021_08510 [Burkholderiales bacterium]|nr:hypothetical protein [Burkholderiales bacterium]